MPRTERDQGQAAPYSNPLPCETCEYCLEAIGGMSRARNIFCEKYATMEHHKPSEVLWGNKPCPEYKKAED